ncbi:unnamed protein product [Linum tenue]|uniref:CMP/dCMP-type deaminase domain-containing protein n=1 Tax=Linum tenue TaxID=586396 RepID=A0AAV0RFK5_9ROSI|nr:unnamed protein product [Linum tenue]
MDGAKKTDCCVEITYIPDTPPIPPDQQPTVSVFASVLTEPKHANNLIRFKFVSCLVALELPGPEKFPSFSPFSKQMVTNVVCSFFWFWSRRLNQIAPLEDLPHVKRIHKRHLEGKVQLSIILCLASGNDDQRIALPQAVKELVDSYQLSPFVTQVCKYAATSKEQWVEQCKLWPTSYHPPTFNIDGITGFSDEDSQSVYRFMKMAIDLANTRDNLITNAAVIVNPSVQQIIASACDEAHSCHKHQSATSCCNSSNGIQSQGGNPLSGESLEEPQRLRIVASCLNPWQWSQQECSSTSTSYQWHPLRHAALVAIESSAERDRRLFPGSDNLANQSFEVEPMLSACERSPAKRQKPDHENVKAVGNGLDSGNHDSSSALMRPYLCTGYDIFLVCEPCPMCAMALVHQRIRRIFYAFPNANAGALGSVHRLQGEKSLNHHYAVFQVKFQNESLNL